MPLQAAKDAAYALLAHDLGAAPTGATVRRLRALCEACRALTDLGVDEALHVATLEAYLRPREGLSDRDLGAAIKREQRWHLVTMAAAALLRGVYQRDGRAPG